MPVGHPSWSMRRFRPPETPCWSRNLSQRQPKVTAAAPLWFYSSPRGNTSIRIELEHLGILQPEPRFQYLDEEIAGYDEGVSKMAEPKDGGASITLVAL
ncbi:hypothetical protein V502_09080 [Pseudogymnoascus sp. VKM F-4520 (FW-2644)]|nr:hypothetical protein V502_09080 [Pseudogymnoascus sp. VKM F-4520 (FW-2644)]